MKIIFRNFFNLLAIGAFDAKCTVETMSEFKWNKLLQMAEANSVRDVICQGIATTGAKYVPEKVYETALNDCTSFQASQFKEIGNYNFAASRQIKQFAMPYLNRRYNNLVFNEIHNIDTSIESLILLKKLIESINILICTGLDIRNLAYLGTYLRNYGDKIDFVKTENWITLLNLRSMCNLTGCFMHILFAFEQEELPFARNINTRRLSKADKIIMKSLTYNQTRPLQQVEKNDTNIINPIHIKKQNIHPLKYFNFFPVETSGRFVSNIIKSLSNIDE